MFRFPPFLFMLTEVAKITACLLWLLLCLRIYTMISRQNTWQRRFIAIAAGIGAGLIYLLSTLLVVLLSPTPSSEENPSTEPSQSIRIESR